MPFDISAFLVYCYAGNIIEPYWYLNAYLGYLIILPFIRAIAKGLDIKTYKYLLYLGLFKICVDAICIISGYRMNVSVLMWENVIFYPLLGHILGNVYCPGILKKNRVVIPSLLGVLLLAVACAEVTKRITGTWNGIFLSIAVFSMAVLVYMLFKNLSYREGIGTKISCLLGKCVFGVYLIEDVVRNGIQYRLKWNFGIPSPFVSALLFSLASLIIGLGCIFILKRLQHLGKGLSRGKRPSS